VNIGLDEFASRGWLCIFRYAWVWHDAPVWSKILLAHPLDVLLLWPPELFSLGRAAFAPMEESKVVSSCPVMVNFRSILRAAAAVFFLLLFSVAAESVAQAQFTLTAATFQPSSVDPGGSATSILTLTTGSGFTGAVNLSCTVTSSQVTSDLPVCGVSPISESASSTPSLTVTTSGSTPPGTYQIAVTGTDGAVTSSATLSFNVADLAEDYTITVYPATAIPSPVVAGSVATTTVTVAPIGTYTGTVTLSCLSETPVVTGAPVCSFSPSPTVQVTGGTPPTRTLTLTTFTTVRNPPSSSIRPLRPHVFYAFWLGIPSLAFVGLGATRKGSRKLFGILFLIMIAGGLLLGPACGNSNAPNSNNAANQVTPANTYTFTLTGSDLKGLGPSSTSSAMVTLQVTAQP
jgi:hypothetical protein